MTSTVAVAASAADAAAPFGATLPPEAMPDLGAEFRKAHVAIAASAARQGAIESRLVNGTVSRHKLPQTVSFANLAAMHSTVKDVNQQVHQYDFVATSGSELVFSSKFNFAPSAPLKMGTSTGSTDSKASRKRRRDVCDDQEDAVIAARQRLAKTLPTSVPSEELDTAQDVIVKMVTQLRGPSQEILVQSFAMLIKRLQQSDDRPRVVLALRLNAGIPVPLSQLKRCLGPCWKDGVVSTTSSVNGVCDRDLPLTEEGTASMEQGNMPLLVVTSVPLHA